MRAGLWKVLAATAALLGLVHETRAQSPEEFYHAKQVRIIVSFDAGTDYDQWARLIARHLGRHLDGHPSLVVQNMGAAGGILATNHLFNVAPHDGTVIGMIGRNLPYFALMQEANARYEPAKFNWIGSPELTNRVCTAYERSAVRKAEDLFERELLTGGAGAASAVSTTPVLLSKLLGMKFKLIEGYPAPGPVLLAMERGEVEGLCQTVTSIRGVRPGWIESGKLRIPVQHGANTAAELQRSLDFQIRQDRGAAAHHCALFVKHRARAADRCAARRSGRPRCGIAPRIPGDDE